MDTKQGAMQYYPEGPKSGQKVFYYKFLLELKDKRYIYEVDAL
eukprot:TRINITY_DN5655_c0_g1_i1.p2 TRINITY_DN5655_c0_g1~~TRINITY_DN5655_c0_g1_i1.p2  ORF type:complete len:50 (+),score=6.70 TRINITY_DN5655_c0_g1_i1:23-151(+)